MQIIIFCHCCRLSGFFMLRATQSKTAATANLKSKQLLLFVFALAYLKQ